MEDPRWLRLVTVGLVLAALAVGYFLLTGRFTSNNQSKPSPTPIPAVSETTTPTPSSVGVGSSPSATPSAVASDPRMNVTTLPATGYQLIILGMISAGVMISGLGLRKYPH